MTLIPFREANPIPPPGSYKVDWSGGTFDVRAALKSGNGQFTVDDSTQTDLVVQLSKFPGVYRADGSGPASKLATRIDYGTLANRPSIDAVVDGYPYWAVDDDAGGVMHQASGGAWVRRTPRSNLAYAQITANQTGFGTSATDVTGLSITLTAPSRTVWLEANLPFIKLNTTAGSPSVFLTDSGNNLVAQWSNTMTVAAFQDVKIRRRLTILTPGTSYTFKVRVQAPASATLDVLSNVDAIPTVLGGPSYIRAYEE